MESKQLETVCDRVINSKRQERYLRLV